MNGRRIGLIDVDGHNFPNLALMRISQYHKQLGDTVEWWWSDLIHYDIVYMSKVFSDSYSKDVPEPLNAGKVIKGGTGYAITNINGKEVFQKEKHNDLPKEIERCNPDYSIYPKYDFAVSMTSRGCPRRCDFCHVEAKEGRCSVKVANVSDFWFGQKEIRVLDPNITACKEKRYSNRRRFPGSHIKRLRLDYNKPAIFYRRQVYSTVPRTQKAIRFASQVAILACCKKI